MKHVARWIEEGIIQVRDKAEPDLPLYMIKPCLVCLTLHDPGKSFRDYLSALDCAEAKVLFYDGGMALSSSGRLRYEILSEAEEAVVELLEKK